MTENTMTENGMTIYHDGDSYPIELTRPEADTFSDLALILKYVPRERAITPAEVTAREERKMEHERQAADFGAQIKRLAALDHHDLTLVLALVELIEFGDANHHGGNWVLEFIKSVLWQIQRVGPATLLEQDPRSALTNLAGGLSEYWDLIRGGRTMAERHPSLFPAPPAEPEAVSESSTTSKPAKPRRARKVAMRQPKALKRSA
jgi:hypothetical protein